MVQVLLEVSLTDSELGLDGDDSLRGVGWVHVDYHVHVVEEAKEGRCPRDVDELVDLSGVGEVVGGHDPGGVVRVDAFSDDVVDQSVVSVTHFENDVVLRWDVSWSRAVCLVDSNSGAA